MAISQRLALVEVSQHACAVGVVVFNPDIAILAPLLAAVGRDGNAVWLFLNSPLEDADIDELRAQTPHLHLLNDGENLGLGTAYNRLATAAADAGWQMLLMFDQDSSPPAGLGMHLLKSHALLVAKGERPALVGPLVISANNGSLKTPPYRRQRDVVAQGKLWPAAFVISSGSLIDLRAFDAVGGFREDFFIDAIDIEWCFRAWDRGYSCWIDNDVAMPHRLGLGIFRLSLINMHLTRQPALRLYTYVRNQVAMLTLPHVAGWWKLRILPQLAIQCVAYLVLETGTRAAVFRAFWFGVSDGMRGRLGNRRRDEFS